MTIYDGLADIFADALGEPVIYTPLGGVPVTINAIRAVTPVMSSFEETATHSVERVLHLRKTDVPNLAEGDGFVDGGKTYRAVEPIIPDAHGMMSVALELVSPN